MATFVYSTGGASKTGQMKEVAEGEIFMYPEITILHPVRRCYETLTISKIVSSTDSSAKSAIGQRIGIHTHCENDVNS